MLGKTRNTRLTLNTNTLVGSHPIGHKGGTRTRMGFRSQTTESVKEEYRDRLHLLRGFRSPNMYSVQSGKDAHSIVGKLVPTLDYMVLGL